MRYIIAVSGGIDSVVLLDLMSRTEKDLVVAHFDQEFVRIRRVMLDLSRL